MALRTLFVLLVSLISVNFSLSARIAGFSGVSSGSHYFAIKKVMEELSSRGHEVGSLIAVIALGCCPLSFLVRNSLETSIPVAGLVKSPKYRKGTRSRRFAVSKSSIHQ